MNPSSNLFLIGPSGAGKTAIGRRLAEHFGCRFVDLDSDIEQHTGVDIPTIFDIEGEAGFRRREHERLAECSRATGIVLATGAGAILDPDNRRLLRAHGFVTWLQASVGQQLERLEHDRSRPLLAHPDRRERLQHMAAEREPLYAATAELAVPGFREPVGHAGDRAIALVEAAWKRPQTA